MKKINQLICLAMLALSGEALALQPYNLPRGVTDISQSVYGLHMFAFWVCVGIGVVVFGVMLWSIYFHRKSRNYKPATFYHSTKLEIIWTVIPIIILVALATPGTRVLMEMYDVGDAELDVKVTGYQWKWRYEYMDKNVDYFSNLQTPRDQIINQEVKGETYLLEVDEPLVLPVNTRVRFLVTAADVLHSWWVPELSVKKDAIPGFINEAWTVIKEEGIYRGQCTELCGADHAFMPVVVRAVDQQTFDAWLAERQQESEQAEALASKTDWTKEELMERGEQVYAINCASCHQLTGKGVPPTFPALDGSAVVLGPFDEQINVLLNGRQGTAMAAFGRILNDSDIAAVITYTRNVWGNKDKTSPDAIMPQEVSAQRGGS